MESPISILWPNIIKTFENVNSDSLDMHRDAIESEQLSKVITYDNRKDKVKTPFVDLNTREINLQETYLAHLWAFIYSVIVIYEEGVQKPLLNDTFKGTIEYNTDLLIRAKLLYDWSLSLADKYSVWDEKLPNPRRHNTEKEQYYAEKVNNIFQSAVAYQMFHEFAHLTLGHDSYFPKPDAFNVDEGTLAELIHIENEADKFAFDMLIREYEDENKKVATGLSILLPHCSSLMLASSAGDIKQTQHPDLDQRMLNALQRLNLEEDEAQFYIWYLCCYAIRLYLLKHNIDIDPGEHETAKDAFFALLDDLDRIKAS